MANLIMKSMMKLSLLCALALIVCLGRAGADEKPARKTVLGKEKLVARDVGRGGETYLPRWCGNAGLIFSGEKMGIEFIEFASGKRVLLSGNRSDARALNCTPDGRWIVYIDQTVRVPDGEELSGPACTYPKHTMRLNTATGKTEDLGTIHTDSSGSYDAISPDGKKILLGPRHENTMEFASPGWEGVWFRQDWDSANSIWFHDSSGVVFSRNNPNALCAEVFGKRGWARCFKLGPEFKDNISDIVVDKDNRVYFKVNEYGSPGRNFMYRCGIGKKGVSCKKLFENKKRMIDFAALPGGDIVFSEAGGNCIRRFTPGQTDAKCLVGAKSQEKTYDYVGLDGVTHNGKWLVVERLTYGEKYPYVHDLFVIELSTE